MPKTEIRLQRVPVAGVDVWRPLDRTSAASRRLDTAIGRFDGERFQVALGQEVVMTARAAAANRPASGITVEALALRLSDSQMDRLVAAAMPRACGADWAEAMGALLEAGVPEPLAGMWLGVRQRSDAWRLARMAAWSPALLRLAREHGLTVHQMRWLDGLSAEDAEAALGTAMDEVAAKAAARTTPGNAGRPCTPTVAMIRAAAAPLRTAKRRREKPEAPYPSSRHGTHGEREGWMLSASESQRIGELTSTTVQVFWKGDRVEVEADYFTVGDLANIMEAMSRTHGNEPEGVPRKRVLRIELDSHDELAYLTGTADD